MPYVVTYKPPKGKEISLDQILFCETDYTSLHKQRVYPGTVTRHYDSLPHGLYRAAEIRRLIAKLSDLPLIKAYYPSDMRGQYRTFTIPKRSGGQRTICEPCPRLYQDQVNLRTLFEKDFSALYHTTAFAYCKGRSIIHCIKRHQANKSKWFLKLDFENFFGNTNMSFVLRQLSQIAPFSEVMKDEQGSKLLEKALRICFFDDGLPQGTPISPMLTNLVMIPIDHELNKALHARGFVYTRYADDMQISHREKFKPDDVIAIVNSVLRRFCAPYTIKQEKTRFGSSSGRNWNLGLMLNGENQITIGHKQHKLMKARMHSFVMDTKNGKPWPREDVMRLAGQLAYFQCVEHQTVKHIVKHLDTKLNVNFSSILKRQLK